MDHSFHAGRLEGHAGNGCQPSQRQHESTGRGQLIEIQDIDGVPLGMLVTDALPFKASLILTERFRELVRPALGWPVHIVAPSRDFVYVIPQANYDFLGRLGGVVLQEYGESGYPVTADVLEVGDDGVSAIGSFAPKDR